jgi:hypothetical protein
MCIRTIHDYENNPPDGNYRGGFYLSSYTGTTFDPYLIITLKGPSGQCVMPILI